MSHRFLQLSPRISVVPVIHGSGDFAVEVRRVMLGESFDCVAVPLPPSFQEDVERAIGLLPSITAVLQEEPRVFDTGSWTPESDLEDDADEDDGRSFNYVPIDPCQPVIAALRIALQERIPRAYVDLETARFESRGSVLPDPYALKHLPLEKFAAGLLPALPQLTGQQRERVLAMADRLRNLECRYERILFVCELSHWPWVKDAYELRDRRREPQGNDTDLETPSTFNLQPSTLNDDVEPTILYAVEHRTLLFLLGELPYITGLYEAARAELDDDENLSIDGVKQLLLATRDRYRADLGNRARKITPHLLRTYLKYVRNLSLIHRRLTPDFYTLVVAAQQLCGDPFAVHLAELVREYNPTSASARADHQGPSVEDPSIDSPSTLNDPLTTHHSPLITLSMGIASAQLPDGDVVTMKSRLPGPPVSWSNLQLTRRPPQLDRDKFRIQWNPFSQCSWPPEDEKIERFRTHVMERALGMLGQDLANSEKFTTSLKDGLDIRETLRNWHTGDLYVKVIPPSRGRLDCVVMLFDSPADPRNYPWRITWHAEHHDESTLSLFATDFHEDFIGPGIAVATYGGAMFLFPPRPLVDIWRDPQFDAADTLEERLLLAACCHARERHIAVLSEAPPGLAWRRIAKRFNKRLVHVPLGHFSNETIQQLRTFHVLNGQEVRSYAEHFIRKV
ncbi:MAG: hypothetical protein KF861_18790 [Planctomycetaceae bacterium]|nr:hypothetical protein [Planctomycetaceae bacterium]